ncbi:hypothetical protein GMLC_05260 [Geomonas limicola]|uniref:Uncharacterized protein n=1 Tax=Geomonas limicola TaxID=2740186 RepID=A0A6V8N541_9BACT|nr:hypothetical protein GMLC_05260 [Geomonas limicola]
MDSAAIGKIIAAKAKASKAGKRPFLQLGAGGNCTLWDKDPHRGRRAVILGHWVLDDTQIGLIQSMGLIQCPQQSDEDTKARE